MAECPSGSGTDLDKCCGPVVAGEKPALTAKALMRSRYTAFVLGDPDHIENTHACDKREGLDRPGVKNMFCAVEWDGLEIFSTSGGLEGDEAETVDFAARFRRNRNILVYRENSNFRRDNGRWIYVDGPPQRPPQVPVKLDATSLAPAGREDIQIMLRRLISLERAASEFFFVLIPTVFARIPKRLRYGL